MERKVLTVDEDHRVPKANPVCLAFQALVDRKENAVRPDQRVILDRLVHVEPGDQRDQREIKEKVAILARMEELVIRVIEDQRETLELLE